MMRSTTALALLLTGPAHAAPVLTTSSFESPVSYASASKETGLDIECLCALEHLVTDAKTGAASNLVTVTYDDYQAVDFHITTTLLSEKEAYASKYAMVLKAYDLGLLEEELADKGWLKEKFGKSFDVLVTAEDAKGQDAFFRMTVTREGSRDMYDFAEHASPTLTGNLLEVYAETVDEQDSALGKTAATVVLAVPMVPGLIAAAAVDAWCGGFIVYNFCLGIVTYRDSVDDEEGSEDTTETDDTAGTEDSSGESDGTEGTDSTDPPADESEAEARCWNEHGQRMECPEDASGCYHSETGEDIDCPAELEGADGWSDPLGEDNDNSGCAESEDCSVSEDDADPDHDRDPTDGDGEVNQDWVDGMVKQTNGTTCPGNVYDGSDSQSGDMEDFLYYLGLAPWVDPIQVF